MKKLHIPPSHMNISRKDMPQIRSDFMPLFKEHLKNHGIKCRDKVCDPKHLKATQGEFNLEKVKHLIKSPISNKPIIKSNDHFIMDGHHRWLADLNTGKKTDAVEIDLPILDLLHMAKNFSGTMYKAVVEQRVKTIKSIVNESLEKRKVI